MLVWFTLHMRDCNVGSSGGCGGASWQTTTNSGLVSGGGSILEERRN
jgi:hypothetical protein